MGLCQYFNYLFIKFTTYVVKVLVLGSFTAPQAAKSWCLMMSVSLLHLFDASLIGCQESSTTRKNCQPWESKWFTPAGVCRACNTVISTSKKRMTLHVLLHVAVPVCMRCGFAAVSLDTVTLHVRKVHRRCKNSHLPGYESGRILVAKEMREQFWSFLTSIVDVSSQSRSAYERAFALCHHVRCPPC